MSISAFCNDGFIWDKDHKCQIYTTANSDKRSFTYTGGICKNNFLEGKATVNIYDQGSLYMTVIGEFQGGYFNGKAEIHYSDGEKFLGDVKNSKWVNGVRYIKNGNVYTGSFTDNGEYIGQATMKYPNGDRFEGPFVSGAARFDKGTCYLANGNRFVGSTKLNAVEIEGTIFYKNGTTEEAILNLSGTYIKVNPKPKQNKEDISKADKKYFSKTTISTYRSSHSIKPGNITLKDNSSGKIGFIIYRSDAPNHFWSFLLPEGGRYKWNDVLNQNGKGKLTLANDWGIQIIDEYKGYSPIYFVGDIGTLENGVYNVSSDKFEFIKNIQSLSGNSFNNSGDAADYLDENFWFSSKNKSGEYFIDPIEMEFTSSDILYFTHSKGKGRVTDLLAGDDHKADIEDDEDADAKEFGIEWGSIKNITITKKSNGDYYLDIDCKILNDDDEVSGNRILLYVSAGKQNKIKDALLYLNKYPLNNLREISALKRRYEEMVVKAKDAETAANKENWKNHLRSKFSSVSDAVTFLNSNFKWAYTTQGTEYYVELSFTSSKATITFKNYNSATNKIGSYIGEKILYWSDLDGAHEYQPGLFAWSSESDCFKITTKNNKTINIDGTSTLRLFWKTTYKNQWERIEYGLLYLKEFAGN